MIVETDAGSARWLFDWRDHDRGYVHEGELRWPDAWPAGIPAFGIEASQFAPERIASLMQAARDAWPEPDSAEWLYEVLGCQNRSLDR